jgi:hypothetical protein
MVRRCGTISTLLLSVLPYPMQLAGGLLSPVGNKFRISDQAANLSSENRNHFEHLRNRFRDSLKLRMRRNFPQLSVTDVSQITDDIEASLTGYFREGGLSLATTLFATETARARSVVPSSIIRFVKQASARYEDYQKRQAFFSTSIDALVNAESAERDYLGRLSQGFFAFHALGVFGEAAKTRLEHARDTVWLVDSDVQIAALAIGSSTQPVFADCLGHLRRSGIRLFTTGNLFLETYGHLHFADAVIANRGADSLAIAAAARGQAPYRKSNAFLEGYIGWQDAGNPHDWNRYLFEISGARKLSGVNLKEVLESKGIEIVDFNNWPGCRDEHFELRDRYTERIESKRRERGESLEDLSDLADYRRKSEPEAESLVTVVKERSGDYHILSEVGKSSPSWFISHTSMLNTIESGSAITWQPEAFLAYANTLVHGGSPQDADRAFGLILWSLAQSGFNLLNDRTVAHVFGERIEQTTISIAEQKQLYQTNLEQKYGDPIETVIQRVNPIERPLAALQIANEIAQTEKRKREQAEAIAAKAEKKQNLQRQSLRKWKGFVKR